ncbi:ClpP/crotonase-like domain-containing protein [Mucor mucedo]|uniref:ClpP/crotonase-like domain-containing protein n=1 Tax=Mucor mucedo TaxID=29922 RepID=UPI00221E5FC7|nr:ClpP/crotonase-like domain-containing protein [Mucor mucedo]KAI7891031.1 ClpP/crotonase-like domain-containing protein [Mucor mucedo]
MCDKILTKGETVWEKSTEARLITISGGGSKRKIFSAGGDIKSIAGLLAKEEPSATDEIINNLGKFYELLQFIGTMKTPIIAVMDGIIMGAGSGLIGQLPFKIATENTVYAMPETAIGSFTDSSTTFTLSRFDGNLGLYLGLTGSRFYAEDVVFCGLASHFVHSSNLDAMNAKLAELSHPTLDLINNIIQEFSVKADHIPSKYSLFGEKLNIIDRCFNFNTVEEIVQSLIKDGSKFALGCVKSILRGSPTSLKVMMESLRRAENLSYNECIRMEFRLWQRMPEGMVGHVAGKRVCTWIPDKLEDIDVEDDIRVNLFDALETHQLNFATETDFYVNPHGRYSLPLQTEIDDVISRYSFQNSEDIIAWFEVSRPGKFGVRQKVEDYLKRQKGETVFEKAIAKF